jgi:DNA-binding MarR family transcriptional regulator/GNAT superfamily N-acetyltransferase
MDEVAAVRSFNRFYTRVIGVLAEGLLHTPYSLTEARLIFEVAQDDPAEVVDLRRRLDLDGGYLSRLLTQLEAAGVLTRTRSSTDGRRQVVSLTPAGRAAAHDLDKRSADEVSTLLDALESGQRRRLLGAMAAIESLLGGGGARTTDRRHGPAAADDRHRTPGATDDGHRGAGATDDRHRGAASDPVVVLRPPLPGDLGWVVQRHGALYAKAHGWNATFESMVARIVADFAAGHDPAREAAWIADIDGEPVGSVLCVRHDDETAQLRVLLVEPSARGHGLGTRLVDECVRFARRVGYTRMMLSTYDKMAEARRIYARTGFEITSAVPVKAFGQDLVDEVWARDV